MIVIGGAEQAGIYKKDQNTNIPYDNMILYGVFDQKECGEKGKVRFGQATMSVKVKMSVFEANPVNVGDEIRVFYNQYGKVIEYEKIE